MKTLTQRLYYDVKKALTNFSDISATDTNAGGRKMISGEKQLDLKIGSIVRKHRLALGMTQEQLARALGVSFQQVQKYETGKNRIGAGRLLMIARALNVLILAFYVDDEQQESKIQTHLKSAEKVMTEINAYLKAWQFHEVLRNFGQKPIEYPDGVHEVRQCMYDLCLHVNEVLNEKAQANDQAG